jgi:hypothetical protein
VRQRTIERLLHWTPRILGLLFAAFIGVFALDVFGEGDTFWQTILALTTHLTPSAIALGALTISWRRGWVGGLVFLALGAWYLVTTWGRFHLSAYVVIAGPLFLLGLLFEIDWWYTRHRTLSSQSNNS